MPKLQKVYWDSCVIIDWLENARPERVKVIEPVIRAAKEGNVLIVTSAWAMCEVVKLHNEPLSDDNEQKILDFFKQPYLEIRALDRTIATIARSICRQPTPTGKRLHPKDAVHVATAMHLQLGKIHTFDRDSLVPFSGMFRLKDSAPYVEIEQPSYVPSTEPEPSQIDASGQKKIEFSEAEGSHEAEAANSTGSSNAVPENEGTDAQATGSSEIRSGETAAEGTKEATAEKPVNPPENAAELPPGDPAV